jgi:hypothetical protein
MSKKATYDTQNLMLRGKARPRLQQARTHRTCTGFYRICTGSRSLADTATRGPAQNVARRLHGQSAGRNANRNRLPPAGARATIAADC